MPTVFTHPAVPLAIGWLRRAPASLLVCGAAVSAVPDADVAAFGFGIPYEHPLGHRGFTHSIAFAFLFSAFAAFAYTRLLRGDIGFKRSFAFLFAALLSHGLLDAMTTGGKGVGFFIPFSNERFFFPFRPIRVSPIGASDFIEKAGVVMGSELRWVWLPAILTAVTGLLCRRRGR
jgi:inner membrane protein